MGEHRTERVCLCCKHEGRTIRVTKVEHKGGVRVESGVCELCESIFFAPRGGLRWQLK